MAEPLTPAIREILKEISADRMIEKNNTHDLIRARRAMIDSLSQQAKIDAMKEAVRSAPEPRILPPGCRII